MKRRNNNKRIIFIVLLIVAFGVVGYAALRTNLTINGQTTVAKNNWSVKFTTITPVKNDGTITSTPVVTGDTTFSFGVKLNTPGDEYKVKVKVENQGTIDAMVSGTPTLSGLSDMDDYLDYSVTYADGIAVEAGNLLAADSEDEIIVTLKFKDDIDASDLADLASADVTKTMVFSMTYAQKDNTASERAKRVVMLPEGRTKDNLQVGDEIYIAGNTNEYFNFIRYDGNDIVMLAKWNLNVGYFTTPTNINLQNTNGSVSYGGMPFSNNDYWDNGSGLKPEYGSSYPADVYDPTNYNGEYGEENYSIACYVERYKTILTEYGATIKEARLLKYSEAVDSSIGCYYNSRTDKYCPTTGPSAFITNTSFWLGSATGYSGGVWSVLNNGKFCNDYNLGSDTIGVRPVIVIEKSSI